jgi:hypothetical protein
MTKWVNAIEKMWARRGVTIVPMPFELTKAGGGGGLHSQPYKAVKNRRRRTSKKAIRDSPACQATNALIKTCGFKGLQPNLAGDVNVYGAPNGGQYLGTVSNVFEGAAARNAYLCTKPGDINHNKEFKDEDGAPMEFSRRPLPVANAASAAVVAAEVHEPDAELPLLEPEVDVVAEEEAAAKRAEEEEAVAKRAEEEAAAKRAEEKEAATKRAEEEIAEEQRQFDAELLAERQAFEERQRERVAQQRQRQDARKAALRAA